VTLRSRTSALSPGKRYRRTASRSPTAAIHTVPTGFSGVPPDGPATLVLTFAGDAFTGSWNYAGMSGMMSGKRVR